MTRRLVIGDVIKMRDKDNYKVENLYAKSLYTVIAEYPHIYIVKKQTGNCREVAISKNDVQIKNKIERIKEKKENE